MVCEHEPDERFGFCLSCADSASLDSISSYDPTDKGKLLRVSKSSWMGYRWCPRRYWWEKVQLKHIRSPPTAPMIRGSEIHDGLEHLYRDWDGQNMLRPLLPESDEEAYDTLADLEQQRIELWGIEYFKPFEVEEKRIVYDPDNDIVLVGKIDGLLLHPEGGICILELKTGSFNSNKISKTRLELCFYARLLKLMGEEREITHFAFLGPDADDYKFLTSVKATRNKVVLFGKDKGMLIVEKTSMRSFNSFAEKFPIDVNNIRELEWGMKWNDYTCPIYCDFHLSCESELEGFDFEW